MKDINHEMHFDNYRQIKIVKMLMDHEAPIRCSQFAAQFRVSERLIREDIKALKYILGRCKVTLLSKRGIGYYLDMGDVDLESIIKDSLGSLYYYDNVGVIDKFAREQLILRYLILHNREVKPQEIMDEFFISRTTLKKDLERAKETMEHYPISLVTTPYQGIYLAGGELGKRMLLNRETAFYKDQSIFHVLHERIEMNGITIEDLLHFVRNTCSIEISNVDLFNLYSHMNIMLLRVSQKQTIQMEELQIEGYVQPEDYEKVSAFLSIYQDLSQLPEAEIYYFCLLVLSSGYRKDTHLHAEEEKSNYLLKLLQEETTPHLLDHQISADIARLWLPLEVKSMNSISSSPLLVRDIKKFKPLAIDLACRYSDKMEAYYHIKLFDNDICALAHVFQKHMIYRKKPLRILVVSARGSLFTEGLLVADLQRLFPEECFTYCDLYDIEKRLHKAISFIITDVSLTNHELRLPVVKVDFFHADQNAYEIEQLIKACRRRRIQSLLKSSIHIHASSKEAVFRWYAKQYGDEALFQQLMVREEKLTLEVNKRIVVVCLYGEKTLPTCLVQFDSFYWKNADISHALFINYRQKQGSTRSLYEELLLHFDEYFS